MKFWGGGGGPSVKYFHIFGRLCYILVDPDSRHKWDSKSDEGIFLGYTSNNRAYHVFNMYTNYVMESINMVIDDTNGSLSLDESNEDENEDVVIDVSTNVTDRSTNINIDSMHNNSSESEDEQVSLKHPSWRI